MMWGDIIHVQQRFNPRLFLEPKMSLPQPTPSAKRFEGKYAIVTGASKGIGFGIACRLALEGAHVCVHYGRDKAGADACVAQIQGALAAEGIEEVRTMTVSADMGKDDEVKAMFETYFATWSKLDIVIPNAGIQVCSVP